MKKLSGKIAFVAVLALFTGETFAYEVNKWQGSSGGLWSSPANWSLEHAPKATEQAYFPADLPKDTVINVDGDFTVGGFNMDGWIAVRFTGSGTVLVDPPADMDNLVFRTTILDGASLKFKTKNVFAYGSIEVRKGSLLDVASILYLWWQDSALVVNGGEVHVASSVAYNRSSAITVNSGSFACAQIKSINESAHRLDLTINGGAFTNVNDITLVSTDATPCSFTVNGGEVYVGGNGDTRTLLAPDTVVNLNGGKLTMKAAIHDLRLFATQGTAVTTLFNGDLAIHPFSADGQVAVVNGAVAAPNGDMNFTNRVTITGSGSLLARALHNRSAEAFPTIELPSLIVGGRAILRVDNEAREFDFKGPLTLRAFADTSLSYGGQSPCPKVTGPLTIDTRDVNDPTIGRYILLNGFAVKGTASMRMFGGGTVSLLQGYSYYPFDFITVEEGTTLELRDDQYVFSNSGPVHAKKFTLGPDATLSMNAAGSNAVYAAEWHIDPTAKIIVKVGAGYSGCALGVLHDEGGIGFGDISDRVSIVGEGAAGWSAKVLDGKHLVIVKPAAGTDGAYDYEWTGEAGNHTWSDVNNWFKPGDRVYENNTLAFGACDSDTNPIYDKMYQKSGAVGDTLPQLVFRETAVSTFTLGYTRMFTNTKTATDGGSGSGIYSLSEVPQRISSYIRSWQNTCSFSAAAGGPLIFDGILLNRELKTTVWIAGDVRFGYATGTFRDVAFAKNKWRNLASRLTILPNSNVTFTNQMATLNREGAFFRVHEGATLRLQGLDGNGTGVYYWNVVSGSHTIDGLFSVEVPLQGGKDQIYGGKGTLKLSSLKPGSAASCVAIADTLTLEIPSWPTLVSGGTDCPITLKAYGTPTIKASDGWTYGLADGVTTATRPADRALEVERGAVATITAAGGTVVFKDPVSGEGVLAVSNGVLRVACSCDSEKMTLAARKGAALKFDAAQRLGALDLADGSSVILAANVTLANGLSAAGATIAVADGTAVSIAGDVDLSGTTFDFGDQDVDQWRTVCTVGGRITGTPQFGPFVKGRLVETAAGTEIQCKTIHGGILIVR